MIAAGQPFAILVRHFLWRLVRNGSELGAGGMLGLVAAPGAFSSIILLDKYSTLLDWIRGRVHQDLYTISYPDKYWFLTLSMGVTGIATVLNWDKILPDAQDYWNLAPLPLRPHAILLAKTTAIVLAVLIFAVAVNGVSAILFPLFVSAAAQVRFAAFAQFVAVHAACTILATLFTFCAVFAILGALSAVLPRNLFHALSAWVRGGMLVALVALLASGYAGPAAVVKAVSESGTRALPPFWYLGLYQSWQHRDTPALVQAARLALPGLAAAVLLMVICYALSYRRCFAAVLESRRQPSAQRLLRRLLDLFSARAEFPRACFQFVVRTMLRNEAHRLCLVMSIGVGWLIAFAARGLEAPLAAAYIGILGVRLAFELPAALSANWIFRVALNAHTAESCPTTRVILSFLGPFVLVPTFVFSCLHSGWGAAFLETACVLALSLGLIAIFLEGYRKIPLTYPMPEFRDNFLLLCLVHILGFELFIHLGARLEHAILEKPFLFPLVPIALFGGWFFNRTRWREPGLTFENFRAPVVERLNLSD